MRTGLRVPSGPRGYWPQDEGDLSDDGEDVCGIDMDDVMPVQYYRLCVKAVGPNRTEPDLRASTFARAVLAATDMVQAATEVMATAYAAGASKVKWSKSATGQVVKHVIPRTYSEAASHPECALIWEAMMREMHSHADCASVCFVQMWLTAG